jgi:hypothetical protein
MGCSHAQYQAEALTNNLGAQLTPRHTPWCSLCAVEAKQGPGRCCCSAHHGLSETGSHLSWRCAVTISDANMWLPQLLYYVSCKPRPKSRITFDGLQLHAAGLGGPFAPKHSHTSTKNHQTLFSLCSNTEQRCVSSAGTGNDEQCGMQQRLSSKGHGNCRPKLCGDRSATGWARPLHEMPTTDELITPSHTITVAVEHQPGR